VLLVDSLRRREDRACVSRINHETGTAARGSFAVEVDTPRVLRRVW
jgi:hypothetical protein